MKNRIISLLLAVAMILSMIIVPVGAVEPDEMCPCGCRETLSQVQWKPWSFTEGNAETGHYYLPEDYTEQTGMITVPAFKKICLDLRGNTYATESIRVFDVSGELSIMDSVGTGMILTTGVTNGAGGFAVVESDGELNIHSGTIQFVERENITISSGGLLYVKQGIVNIHGGTLRGGVAKAGSTHARGGNIYMNGGILNITGGTVTGGMARNGDTTYSAQGGNIYALSSAEISISGDAVVSNGYSEQSGGNVFLGSATLNISGGTISGGHAYLNGGNICQLSTAVNSVTISGGKITGGVAAGALADLSSGSTTTRSGGGGGNMYVNAASGTLTISGGIVDGDLTVNSIGTLTLSGQPKIGMGKSNGLMMKNSEKADISGLEEGADIYVWAADVFTQDLDDGAAATAASAYFKGVIRTVVAVDGLALKGTQGTSGTEGYCPHCGSKVAWYAGFAATANQVHRYLTQNDIGTTANKTISQDVVLDLNGFAYQRTTGRILFNTASKSLSILDSYGGGRIECAGAGNSGSGFVYVYSANTTLNLYSGTLMHDVGTATSVVTKGGVVQVGISSAKMNVYGGVISGGTITGTADGGGNIYLASGAKLTMSAGIIKDGNAAAGLGGNIYSKGGADSIEIRDGFILNGTTTGNGGNINSAGKVTMTGGTVAYGSAGNGGNLYGTVEKTISGGVIIGGSATNGGNVYNAAGTLDVTNAQVLCGTASTGGNIYVTGSAVNINSGAQVLGGVSNGADASHSGGNILAAGAATVTVDGGILVNGTTLHRGGNVYLSGAGSFTLKNNGLVFGGSASVCGGNIATNQNSATINLESGLVTGGTSATGPNVCLYNCTATLNIGNATVTGGVYGGKGIVKLSGSARVINEEGTYTGNIAFLADGKLYVSNDWTGEASVSLGGSYSHGETLPDAKGQCGTFGETFEATGSYTGKLVYETLETKPWILGSNGTLIIGTTQLIAKDGSNAWYTSNAAAVSSYDENHTEYLKLMTADNLVLDVGSYVVDLAGQSVTITGPDTSTVACVDSANDAYDADACGTATISGPTLAESPMAEASGKQYFRLGSDNAYTFHRLDMRVNGVSIRPSVAGIYYSSVWSCDDTLKNELGSYGVAVSTANMPESDFMDPADGQKDTLWTVNNDMSQFESGAAKNSVLIQNIFKPDKDTAYNKPRGEKPIYATAYVRFNNGDIYISDKTGDADDVSYSLYSFMEKVNSAAEADRITYRATEKKLKDFYADWQEKGTGEWDFSLIKAPVAPEDDDVMKILMVGQSHAQDTVWLLYDVLKAQMPDQEFLVVDVYRSTNLHEHVENIRNNAPLYDYYWNNSGTVNHIANVTITDALMRENWDLILFNEATWPQTQEEEYNDGEFRYMIDHIREYADTGFRLAYNATWAQPVSSILYEADRRQPTATFRSTFTSYFEGNRLAHFDRISEMMTKYIEPDGVFGSDFDLVFHSGTAIQYASETHLVPEADRERVYDLYRDYTHLSDFGRLLVAYQLYAQIYGLEELTEVNVNVIPAKMRATSREQAYGDIEITQTHKDAIIASVNYALKNPNKAPTQNRETPILEALS